MSVNELNVFGIQNQRAIKYNGIIHSYKYHRSLSWTQCCTINTKCHQTYLQIYRTPFLVHFHVVDPKLANFLSLVILITMICMIGNSACPIILVKKDILSPYGYASEIMEFNGEHSDIRVHVKFNKKLVKICVFLRWITNSLEVGPGDKSNTCNYEQGENQTNENYWIYMITSASELNKITDELCWLNYGQISSGFTTGNRMTEISIAEKLVIFANSVRFNDLIPNTEEKFNEVLGIQVSRIGQLINND